MAIFLSHSKLFFHLDDKDQKKSQKVLAELENIDDECDQNDIAFVKIDDEKEADEWGIDEIPTIVSYLVAICVCVWLRPLFSLYSLCANNLFLTSIIVTIKLIHTSSYGGHLISVQKQIGFL